MTAHDRVSHGALRGTLRERIDFRLLRDEREREPERPAARKRTAHGDAA
jgi:hypothetical protein